jgi:arylsulfatase A-like enzyme
MARISKPQTPNPKTQRIAKPQKTRWMAWCLGFLWGLGFGVWDFANAAAAPQRDLLGRVPNVVFILSDDQRPDTIRALGNKQIKTPNLDRLVQSGLTFTQAFCMGSTVGAVCIPSRAMILSGRSLYRAVSGTNSAAIPRQAALWPEEFRKAGYQTIGIGKWHNDRASYARCFTDGGPIFFGGMSDQNNVPVQNFDPTGRYPTNRQRITTNVFSSELFANAAISSIRQQTTKPFLLYVSFTTPHDPRTPPAEFAKLYDPLKIPLPKNYLPEHSFDNGQIKGRDEELLPWPRTEEAVRKELAAYYAMITHMDHQIGRILDALNQRGKGHNTIIIFASDHGLAIGSHGLLGKQNMYDHSIRAPLIFAGPGIPQGRRSDALCYLYDLFPTLCELAGLPIPDSVEGKSLARIMHGRAESVRDEIFGAYRDVQRMVRTDRWKLIHYPKIDRTQLFDLKADPHELRDLSDNPKHGGTLAQLRSRLVFLQHQFDDPIELKVEN